MEDADLQNILIGELMEGHEQISKLEDQLKESELRRSLKSVKVILEKALSVTKLMMILPQENKQHLMDLTSRTVSQRSVMDSPKSISSEHAAVHERGGRERCKKRKAKPKWTRCVKLSLTTGLEGHPDDGFSWRKYGQKDILDSKHPRAYYRCTHLHSKGCLAKKHVQRSDDDPCIFDVAYVGEHSCFSKQSLNANYEIPLDQLKTEEQDGKNSATSFSFSSAPVSIVEGDIISAPSPDDQVLNTCFFPPFMSSSKSESNHYSLMMFRDSMIVDLPSLNLPAEMNLMTTTTTSSAGFELDELELEEIFSFDATCFGC